MKNLEKFEHPERLGSPESKARAIIDTYDLSDGNKRKVYREALFWMQKIQGHGQTLDFDAVYEEVARAFDKLRIGYRLNSPTNNNEDDIGQLVDPNSIVWNGSRGTHFTDLVPTLADHLERSDLDALQQLAYQSGRYGGIVVDVFPDELGGMVRQITDRLHQLAERYKKNGQWTIPRVKITSISFNPLSIKFKKRHHGGSCRSFYQEHEDFFNGMNTTELAIADPSFYRSIQRSGEIDGLGIERSKACPLLPEEEAAIIAANATYQGNATKAARELKATGAVDRSPETFRNCWKRHKLKINSRGAITPEPKRLSQEEIDEITAAFEPCNGVISKAAGLLKRKRATISKYWRQEGLIQ